MKKKLLALWIMAAMVVSILPVNYVKADTAGDVAEAKVQIDNILKEAPTVAEYTLKIADSVDRLGVLLESIPEENIQDLDTYVADKTTYESLASTASPLYTKVKDFYEAYHSAQVKLLAEEGAGIDAEVEGLLKKAFDRKEYERVRKLYDEADKRIRDSVKKENVSVLDQLKELLEAADRATEAVKKIPALETGGGNYADFAREIRSAETAVNACNSRYTELRRLPVYEKCLTRENQEALIANLPDYNKARLILSVEEAYSDVGSFETMTDDVMQRLAALRKAVSDAQESEWKIAVGSLYNGGAIESLLNQYDRILRFVEMVSLVPDMPSSTAELAGALRAYDYYVEELTQDERALVPEEYRTKLTNSIRLNTDCNDVIDAIDRIGVPESDEKFGEYVSRYEDANGKYQEFIIRYSGVSGISGLITNRSVLEDATAVVELIKSIRSLEETEDAAMCAQIIRMEGIRAAYQGLRPDLQNQIYNIGELYTIYADAQIAQTMRNKIESIKTFTLEDEAYIEGIRTEYDAMSGKAKAYLGASRYAMLTAAETQMRALNQNMANRVIEKIGAIGTVEISSEEAIRAARNAYNALTANQKKLVTNLSVLTAAEKRYEELRSARTLAKANASGPKLQYSYTGSAIRPSVKLRLGKTTLVKDRDYTLQYFSNIERGMALILASGTGNYTGSLRIYFHIVKASVKKARITGLKKTYRYTGKKIRPAIKVKKDGVVLKKKRDYTVTVKKNVRRGTASLTIKGKGNYKGKKTVKFAIR